LACRPGAPRGGEGLRRGRTRMQVEVGLVLEVGDDPDGRAPPVSVRRGRARGLAGLCGRKGGGGRKAG
jgi:hypothetical protein